MKRRALIYLTAFLMLALGKSAANRIYIPEFGSPFAIGDKLIFVAPEYPGLSSHRLICIEKQDGKKVWEKTEEHALIRPWFVLNGQLIVTIGTVIHQCDPQSGKCERLYTAGFDQDIYIEQCKDGLLLVGGAKNNIDYLSLVDSKSWKRLWVVQRISMPKAEGNDTILCEEADRHPEPPPGGGYSLRNQRWVALAKNDGHITWSCPYSSIAEAEGVSNYFLVYLNCSVQCLNERDGSLVSTFKWQDQPYVLAQLMTRNQELLVRTTYLPPRSVFFTLTVPELKWGKLTEQEWKAASNEKYEVKDDTFVFYPSISYDETITSMCRRTIKTGEVKELYKEPVPKAYFHAR